MFKQATVQDIANHRVTKLHGRILVITRHYPRFLKRALMHDYFPQLAPSRALLKEFREALAATGDHERAFTAVDYESKFKLEPEAIALLRELAIESQSQQIYLVCHCEIGQRCHREVIMVIAQELFGAQTSKLSFDWATIRKRLRAGDLGQTSLA